MPKIKFVLDNIEINYRKLISSRQNFYHNYIFRPITSVQLLVIGGSRSDKELCDSLKFYVYIIIYFEEILVQFQPSCSSPEMIALIFFLNFITFYKRILFTIKIYIKLNS